MNSTLRVVYTPEAFNQPVGGVSRISKETAVRLNRTGHRGYIAAGLYINKYIRGDRRVLGYYWPHNIGRVRAAINTVACQLATGLLKRAIIHQTYYSRHYYPASHARVLTVFDMIHEIFPHLLGKEATVEKTIRDKAYSCARADHICAISEHTKLDVMKMLGIPAEKITVTHLGNSLDAVLPAEIGPLAEKKYLLFVGGRRWYKNFANLLSAFQSSELLRNEYYLVCFGGGSFAEDEVQMIQRLGLSNRVLQDSGDDRLLAGYYARAVAHVIASLYEGFGLTLVEAMGLGCPIICSNRSSLPEVAGDAAAYFNPEDVDAIRTAIEHTVSAPAKLEELRIAGLKRQKLFTWDRCFEQTMSVYKKVAG